MPRTLNEKIAGYASVLDMLRNANMGFYQFPMPDEHSNWRVEQRAWQHSAVLFDQSCHMTDLHITEPDRIRLLSDISVNDYSRFGPLRALQVVVCSDSGHIVGDAVLFHLRDGSLNVVGKPSCANFIEYAAASGAYDVTLRKDARIVEGGGARECFRFQLQGPSAFPIHPVRVDRRPVRLVGEVEVALHHVLEHSPPPRRVRFAGDRTPTQSAGPCLPGTHPSRGRAPKSRSSPAPCGIAKPDCDGTSLRKSGQALGAPRVWTKERKFSMIRPAIPYRSDPVRVSSYPKPSAVN